MDSNLPWSEQYRIVAKQEAFEARLIPEPNSGCWLWIGMEQQGRNYGLFSWKQKVVKAHRAAWSIYRGEIPDGLHVLHRCDNPPCVNPDHLFLGTHQDNMADRSKKGRALGPRGESARLAKLTSSEVDEIRAVKYNRKTLSTLSARFGVSRSAIHKIFMRKTWKHV